MSLCVCVSLFKALKKRAKSKQMQPQYTDHVDGFFHVIFFMIAPQKRTTVVQAGERTMEVLIVLLFDHFDLLRRNR